MTVPPTPREVADVAAVRHRTVTVDGVRLYFREAGDPRDTRHSCCCTASPLVGDVP
jgi:hypothetical protein